MTNDQRGYASVLVLGLTLVALGVAGLAIDGTRAFLFRQTLQNAADAAALAGAAEIDRTLLYRSGGSAVAIDPAAARARAGEWLSQRRIPARIDIAAGQEVVRVALRGQVETTFLRVVGLQSVPVSAESSARPIPGDP